MSIWINLQQNPWEINRDMYIIQFTPNGYYCQISTRKNLECRNERGTSLIGNGELRLGSWYMLVLKSKSDNTQMQLHELSYNQIGSDESRSFFPYSGNSFSFTKVNIGINSDERSNALIGSIRNFKLLSSYLDDTTLKRIQFIYLFPIPELQMQIIMNTQNDLTSNVGRGKAVTVGKNTALNMQKDFQGIWWCWNSDMQNTDQILQLSSSFQLSKIMMNNYDTTKYYNMSLQMWIQRTNTNTYQDETLFSHSQILQLKYLGSNFYYLNVQSYPQASSNRVLQAYQTFNKWYYIQVELTLQTMALFVADSKGKQLYYSSQDYGQQIKQSNKEVQIAGNFNGYIRGIKYYRKSFSQIQAYDMQMNVDQTSEILFYFMFLPSWYSTLTQNFFNWALINLSDRLGINYGTVQFQNVYYASLSDNPIIGSLNQNVDFDGYTCGDGKEKLYMSGRNSYAQSTIPITKTITSFTIEFWLKTSGNFLSDAYFLSLSENQNKRQQFIVIQQQRRYLYCYPSFLNNLGAGNIKINYQDFGTDISDWQHIACSYDFDANILRADYYTKLDYTYFNTMQQKLYIQSNNYILSVNTNPDTQQDGIEKSFFAEIRFWLTVRSTLDIQNAKFQQLNVVKNQPLLLSYIKMFNGGYAKSNEIDFADFNLQRAVTFNNIQWIYNEDLIVCPLNMYKGQNDNICYRDSVLNLNIAVIRRDNNYLITPFYSQYRNDFVKNNVRSLFTFLWKVEHVDTQYNDTDRINFPGVIIPQQSNNEIVLQLTDVAQNPGIYDISLTLSDNQKIQDDYKADISFKTLNCLRIFDQETQLTQPFKDIGINRGSQDFYLYYDYSECKDYQFDSTQLQFTYDRSDISFDISDHIPSQKVIVIRQNIQNFLPMNQYFNIRVTGLWRYRMAPNDYIQVTMIFSLRFITVLNLNLQTNAKILMLGQQLQLSSDGSTIINLSNRDQDKDLKNFTLSWQCPTQLQQYCSIAKNNLIISSDIFQRSGLQYWQQQNITLIGTTNFVMGNGLIQVQKTISIVWFPVNPDVQIDGKDQVSSKTTNQYTIVINNLQDYRSQEHLVSILWTITPSISNQALINYNNRKQFVIAPGYFQEGTTYTIGMQLTYISQNTVIYNGSKTVKVYKSPYGGSLQVSPNNGNAISQIFRLQATNWNIQNSPAKYQFFYQGNNSTLIALSPISENNQFATALPVTQKVYVKVIDQNDAFTIAEANVQVSFSNSQSIQNDFDNIDNIVSFVTTDQQYQGVQQAAIFAGSIDQLQKMVDTSKIKETMAQITQSFLNLAKRIKLETNIDNQKYYFSSCIQTFSIMSNYTTLFNISQAVTQQDSILEFQQYDWLLDYFIDDDTFSTNFLSIQANTLNSIKILAQAGQIDITKNNTQLDYVTSKVRAIIVRYERYRAIRLYESQELELDNPAYQISIKKYSRIANALQQVNDQVNGYLNFSFPLQFAQEPTERQSFSFIAFKVNPFIGSQYLNQSIQSNSSVYFAYRDQDGNYLNNSYLDGTIDMYFDYNYQGYSFLPNKTVCAYIGINDTEWGNDKCNVTYFREQSKILCQCKHMSFYSIIEDTLVKPKVSSLIFLSFKNWPAFAVFAYLIFLFIIGLIYTYNIDNSDFRFLHDQDENQGTQVTKGEAINIVTYAFKRKVFFMRFAEDLKFSSLYKIYVMMLHPLLQLKFRLDPQVPRFYKFLFLYTRIVIIMGISFVSLRKFSTSDEIQNDSNKAAAVVISIFVLSLLLIPIPTFMFACFRTKYYLNTALESKEVSDIEKKKEIQRFKREPMKEEKIFIEPNLPIKLLFLINAVPMKDIIQKHKEKLPFANGNFRAVGKKLTDLDFSIQSNNSSIIHSQSDVENSVATPRQVNAQMEQEEQRQNTLIDQQSERKDLLLDARSYLSHNLQIQQPPKVEASFALGPDQIQFEIQGDQVQPNFFHESENIDESNQEEQEEESEDEEEQEEEQNDSQYEGGEEEKKQSERESQRRSQHESQQQDSNVSSEDSSLNTNVFMDERKELLPQRNIIGRVFGIFVLIGINVAIYLYVISIFISEEFYNAESQSSYLWVLVFFLTQIVGFFITDFLALLIMASFVYCCCRKKKSCLVIMMRDSLMLYEDYKYVVQFTQTKLL